MTICKAYFFEEIHIHEYLVSLNNLSRFLLQRPSIDVVVTGLHNSKQFVIRCKKGQIVSCNNAEITYLLNRVISTNQSKLSLYEMLIGHPLSPETVYIYSDSEQQALVELKMWTPKHAICLRTVA